LRAQRRNPLPVASFLALKLIWFCILATHLRPSYERMPMKIDHSEVALTGKWIPDNQGRYIADDV
jgi:hypothetical protein